MICDLYDTIIRLVATEERRKHDWRFMSWVKEVQSINPQGTNGFAFEGLFLPQGTIEIEPKPRVFLIRTTTGSRKYQTAHYSVVVMEASGELKLYPTIYTTNRTSGWALRIRDQIIELVEKIRGEIATGEIATAENPLAGVSDEDLIQELLRRGYNIKGDKNET